mgnify:CR=1 FL=1
MGQTLVIAEKPSVAGDIGSGIWGGFKEGRRLLGKRCHDCGVRCRTPARN